jgi:integrase
MHIETHTTAQAEDCTMSARGTGSVYRPTYRNKQTGIKETSAVWWLSYYVGGQKRRESSHLTNRTQAIALLKMRNGEAVTGRLKSVDMQKTTFKDLAERVRSSYLLLQNRSTPRMERAVKTLGNYFGADALAMSMDGDRIEAYAQSRLAQGKAHATVQYELAILRRGFRLAAKVGKALCPSFPVMAVENARQGFFEPEDLATLLSYLPVYLQPVFRFAWITGWRTQSEILTLQWNHVDFRTGMLHLDPQYTKNKQPRSFPFAGHPMLSTLLRTQYENRGTSPLVFHREGHPIKDYSTAWRSARVRAGQPTRIVHDLRRTAIRNLRRAGVPEQTAMKLSGHKTRAVFDRYDIHNEDDLRDAVSRLAGTPPPMPHRDEHGEMVHERARYGQSLPGFVYSGERVLVAKPLKSCATAQDGTVMYLADPRDFKSQCQKRNNI